MNYLVSSFISIVRYVSEDRVLCEETTPLRELFSDDFDDLDFELALCAFEATHRVAFADRLWKMPPEEYEHLSIEEFLEQYVEPGEKRDALFIAQRFVIFREAIENAYNEPADDGQEPEE